MKFGNYAPSSYPSPQEQVDALQKGLGRAMQWALLGRLDDQPLLMACLNDFRSDWTQESRRANWLWQLIKSANATTRFRNPIFCEMKNLKGQPDIEQLCYFALYYAAEGDDDFRTLFYESVEFQDPSLREQMIMALDGESGFLSIVRMYGAQLKHRDWDIGHSLFLDRAEDRFGLAVIEQLLQTTSDDASLRFREARLAEEIKVESDATPALSQNRRCALSADDIIALAENLEKESRPFRDWGENAKSADLEYVLAHLWVTPSSSTKVLANLLEVFSARAFPIFDERLIELCDHADQMVHHFALEALKQNSNPAIHDYAVKELSRDSTNWKCVGLFAKNYRAGDENFLLEAIDLPREEVELHSLLLDIIYFLESNPAADASRLGVVGYMFNFCDDCRYRFLQILHRQKRIPKWMREEIAYDSNEECSKLSKETQVDC